jgi:hypothetical protein
MARSDWRQRMCWQPEPPPPLEPPASQQGTCLAGEQQGHRCHCLPHQPTPSSHEGHLGYQWNRAPHAHCQSRTACHCLRWRCSRRRHCRCRIRLWTCRAVQSPVVGPSPTPSHCRRRRLRRVCSSHCRIWTRRCRVEAHPCPVGPCQQVCRQQQRQQRASTWADEAGRIHLHCPSLTKTRTAQCSTVPMRSRLGRCQSQRGTAEAYLRLRRRGWRTRTRRLMKGATSPWADTLTTGSQRRSEARLGLRCAVSGLRSRRAQLIATNLNPQRHVQSQQN